MIADRAQIVTSLEGLVIARYRLAVVFMYTSWSAPSNAALAALGVALDEVGAELAIVIVDSDADVVGDWALRELGEVCHGWGETAWIRDGIVRTRMSRYGSDDVRALRALTNAVAIGQI